jgi:hypothetical protein
MGRKFRRTPAVALEALVVAIFCGKYSKCAIERPHHEDIQKNANEAGETSVREQ